MSSKEQDTVPGLAAEAVLVTSQDLAPDTDKVSGYDFNKGIDHHELLKSFKYSGFQATNFGLAVEEIWKMIRCREEDIPADKLEIRLGSNLTLQIGLIAYLVLQQDERRGEELHDIPGLHQQHGQLRGQGDHQIPRPTQGSLVLPHPLDQHLLSVKLSRVLRQ